MKNIKLDKLITESLAIEAESARVAGKLGFMARALVQATLPHSKPESNEFIRTNGAFKLKMLSPSDVGLPYGNMPRLLMSWLTTEAIRRQDRHIVLGSNLSQFMKALGIEPTGGQWGSITRLKEQSYKLFSCFISCSYTGRDLFEVRNISIADKAELWWNPVDSKQKSLWENKVVLSESFYNEIVENPVPIDMRALKALKRSPMAIDIYCWITYRMSYLQQVTNIYWPALQTQFGANYSTDPRGVRNFKMKFLHALKKVHIVYPTNVENVGDYLRLKPSDTHIPKIYTSTYPRITQKPVDN